MVDQRQGWDLRGAVRSCRVERTWFSRQCGAEECETEECSDSGVVEFGKDGLLRNHLHRNLDGSRWRTVYEYDHACRLIERRSSAEGQDGAGTVHIELYQYDELGRPIRTLARTGESGERVTETYLYDEAGRKQKTFHIDVASQRADTRYSWGIEGTDSCYSAPGAATMTTAYDELGHPLTVSFHDAAGNLLSRIELTYDQNGKLIKEAQVRAEPVFPPEILESLSEEECAVFSGFLGESGKFTTRVHRYDENGHRVESSLKMGPLGGDRISMTYNEYGDIVEQVTENESREYSLGAEESAVQPEKRSVSRSEARFHYEYDAQGNWTVKTVKNRAEDLDFTVCSVDRRSIDYFE